MTIKMLLLGMVIAVAPVLVAVGQISIEPPPETKPESKPATEVAPATKSSASTLPTAENVLENLLHDKPAVSAVAPRTTTGPMVPALVATAAGEPKSKLMRERDTVEKRIGRLVKDDATSNWVFVFDADGRDMYDAPLTIVPSMMLEAMEGLSEKGTKPVKFKVSGEVTQYRGKNFLVIRYAQVVKDLSQGLGG